MKIVINVIPEAFIGNPVSLKGAGNHLDSRSLLKTCWDKLCGNDGFDLMPYNQVVSRDSTFLI